MFYDGLKQVTTTEDIAELISERDTLLAICKEIADDSRCDLVYSERRIRLYAAITKTGSAL